MWLFALFIAVPLIEIALFIQIGGAIGLWPTLAIVVVTAVVGTQLMRAQGILAMNQLRNSFGQLQDPTEPLAHGAMILFSGALLLTPGFFTDFVGFSLLIPPVRSAVYAWGRSRVKVASFSMGGQSDPFHQTGDDDIVDADFQDVTPQKPSDAPRVQGPSGWTKD